MKTFQTKHGLRYRLTLDELADYRSQGHGQMVSGRLRFFCPIHGSDNQRSMSVDPESGWFICYACQERGLVEDFNDGGAEGNASKSQAASSLLSMWRPPPSPKPELEEVLSDLQEGLGSSHWHGFAARNYLRDRQISLDLARYFGIGYAEEGGWPHRSEDGRLRNQWDYGRIVFPLTDPDGRIISLYGRSVSVYGRDAPKKLRHAKLPGRQGLFNASALASGERIWLCEGPFDALSLATVGIFSAVALCGLEIPCWRWFRDCHEVVLALDTDIRAQERTRELRRAFVLRGKEVLTMPAEAIGGCKDLNEALIQSRLDRDLLLRLGGLDTSTPTLTSKNGVNASV